jgi:hypothetical protein
MVFWLIRTFPALTEHEGSLPYLNCFIPVHIFKVSSMHAVCPAELLPLDLIILNLKNTIMFFTPLLISLQSLISPRYFVQKYSQSVFLSDSDRTS